MALPKTSLTKTLKTSILFCTVVCGALFYSPIASATEKNAFQGVKCPSISPIITLRGAERIYIDREGSIPDVEQIAKQQEFIKPLRQLVAEAASRVDRRPTDNALLECATALLSTWATSSALLGGPIKFSAARDRARFAIGLNIVSLKLRAAKQPVSQDIVKWLHLLNSAVMRDFGRRRVVDNLYAWSGVNAATFSVLTDDLESSQYSDQVWTDAIAQIDSHGAVPSELKRRGRATLYHNYYLSALLLLREVRRAQLKPKSMTENDAIRRLTKFVSKAFCNPIDIQELSGGYEQVATPAAQLAVPFVFMDENERKDADCMLRGAGKIDLPIGGDLSILKELLD